MTYSGLSLNYRGSRESMTPLLRGRCTFSFLISVPLPLSSLASLLLSFSFLFSSLPSLLTRANERGSLSRGCSVHLFCKHQSWVHYEEKDGLVRLLHLERPSLHFYPQLPNVQLTFPHAFSFNQYLLIFNTDKLQFLCFYSAVILSISYCV